MPQIAILHNMNAERLEQDPPGYVDEAFIMLNYMLLVSRRFVLFHIYGVQIGVY